MGKRGEIMDFASDNVFGVHETILAAITEANRGTAPSYGHDAWTKAGIEELSRIFETEIQCFLVTTGTAANALALSALTPAYGAILCHGEAHISTDECGAAEFFSGAKLTLVDGIGCKLSASAIEGTLSDVVRGEHESKPSAVSISQSTELGLVYSASEVAEIGRLCRSRGLKLHMDGSRFANALVSGKGSASELTWKSGVDAMSFGCTKNGALALEAVIFFNREVAEDFIYRRKRAGQLLSKGRFLGAQLISYLKDELWLENARHANAMGQMLAKGLVHSRQIRVPLPVEANEVFAIMPRAVHASLESKGVGCHEWLSRAFGADGPKPGEAIVRFVTSFRTRREDVERLVELCGSLKS